MRPQSQDDLIESLEDIVDTMREILVQQGDDSEILRQARIALSDWFVAMYPHLYPGHGRPALRLLKGGGRKSRRQAPLLSPVREKP